MSTRVYMVRRRLVDDDDEVRTGRDSAATRRSLVRAARRRFATDGYRATTVRQIAADAGVNVALINRYFVSKEGLFEACMLRTSDELDIDTRTPSTTVDEVITKMLAHVGNGPDGDDPLQLLLLLRSSGDEAADAVRRRILLQYARGIATVAGRDPDDPGSQPFLLRAELAISMLLGIVMLRSSSAAVEPLAGAGPADLDGPLRAALRALLADG